MMFGIIAVYVPIPTPVDRLVVLFCPNCQARIPVSSKFCPECGVDLRQKISEQRKKREKVTVTWENIRKTTSVTSTNLIKKGKGCLGDISTALWFESY
jgi:ribosomal protein L40E